MRINPIYDGELIVLGFIIWAAVWFMWGDWYTAFLLFTVAYGAALGRRWAWAWREEEWGWNDDFDEKLASIEERQKRAG